MNKKILDPIHYRFDAAGNKIHFHDKHALSLKHEEILIIINLTKANELIYNFACKSEGGTYDGKILSLTYDTTSMSDSDELMVVISDIDNTAINTKLIVDLLKDSADLRTDLTQEEFQIITSELLRDIRRHVRPRVRDHTYISTATTTVVYVGPGVLNDIVVNNPTNNTISIYDGLNTTTGRLLAIIDPDTKTDPFQLTYDVSFVRGLTIVTAGSPNLTIIYTKN
jgi:hypothetical protein